jgi:hypothetical protein
MKIKIMTDNFLNRLSYSKILSDTASQYKTYWKHNKIREKLDRDNARRYHSLSFPQQTLIIFGTRIILKKKHVTKVDYKDKL